jgi:hypothetical protein
MNTLDYEFIMSSINWDRAGYSDTKGVIGNAIPPGDLYVPERVWIEDEFLKYESWKGRKPAEDILHEFVRLWEAPNAKILAFAKKHGVLWENGLELKGQEPLKRWRQLSRVSYAFLKIGAQLAAGDSTIDASEWTHILAPPGSADAKAFQPGLSDDEYKKRILETFRDPEAARMLLPTYVNRFLPPITLQLAHSAGGPLSLQINYDGKMTHAMALQLVTTLCNCDLYICSGCQYPYPRPREKRRPRSDQANFCNSCGTNAAWRMADERRRAQRAQARRLSAAGQSPREIAKQLNTTVSTIRGWLRKQKKRKNAD